MQTADDVKEEDSISVRMEDINVEPNGIPILGVNEISDTKSGGEYDVVAAVEYHADDGSNGYVEVVVNISDKPTNNPADESTADPMDDETIPNPPSVPTNNQPNEPITNVILKSTTDQEYEEIEATHDVLIMSLTIQFLNHYLKHFKKTHS